MNPASAKPLVAITQGDPAGIGPEIIAAAWPSQELHQWCRPIVVGYADYLRRAAAIRKLQLDVREIANVEDAEPTPCLIPCLTLGDGHAPDIPPGRIDARAGEAAHWAILLATEMALSGKVQAVVTAPINKEALQKAGYQYPGHTELFAELCRTREFAMLLYLAPGTPLKNPVGLSVIHVTLHMALRKVFQSITVDEIHSKIKLADGFVALLKEGKPRIGVCALNPHGGEGGLFGSEEVTIIGPAVRRAQSEGINADGPLPADSAMVHARDGRFDAVVAMYHDQGHIALKLLGMKRAVNVTVGLPIVRTSVAHGTAFDIAWKGVADPGSLLEAIRVAALLAARRTGGPSA